MIVLLQTKFLFSATRHEHNAHKSLQIIESGMYACTYLDNYDDEIDYAKQLKQYCEQNHYIIAGDYICEVMTAFNVFNSDHRSMFLKLQIPVNFPK